MLLIAFIENAFKYGISSEEDCIIKIRIFQDDKILLFETENNIMKEGKDELTVGIENCKKRLELIYPQRFELY